MTNINKFIFGVLLFVAYPIFDSCFLFYLFLSPASPSENLFQSVFELMEYNYHVFSGIVALGSIAGLVLLVHHYHLADETERRRYRLLDRYISLMLILSAGLVIIPHWLIFFDGPAPYVGLTHLLWVGQQILFGASALVWAGALVRSNGRWALLASAVYIAALWLPTLPTNNPLLLAEIQDSLERQESQNDFYEEKYTDLVDTTKALSIEESQTSSDTVLIKTVTHKTIDVIDAWKFAALLLMVYTWMRLGKFYLPKELKAFGGYGAAELLLVAQLPLFLVVYTFMPLVLGFLLPDVSLEVFGHRGAYGIVNTLWMIILCIAFYVLYRGSRYVPPERTGKTDRRLGAVLMLYGTCIFTAVVVTLVAGYLNPQDVLFQEHFMLRALYYLGGSASFLIGGWGLAYSRPLWAIGGMLGRMSSLSYSNIMDSDAIASVPYFMYSFALFMALLMVYTCLRFSDLYHKP